MATIAWYGLLGRYPLPDVMSVYIDPPEPVPSEFPEPYPDTANAGTAARQMYNSLSAGFVGQPDVLNIPFDVTFETVWEAVNDTPEPGVFYGTRELYVYNQAYYDYYPVASTPTINFNFYRSRGIMTVRARVNGVLADGELTLVIADVGSGYSDLSWSWGPGGGTVAPDAFWAQLVYAVQT